MNCRIPAHPAAVPDGALIYNIVRHTHLPDTFVFYVEHPDLPELQEGETPLEIEPRLTADYERKPSTWLTWDWNLPENAQENDDDK